MVTATSDCDPSQNAAGRAIPCPQPRIVLTTKAGSGHVADDALLDFLIDTGSDVTLLPLDLARKLKFIGYDPSAVLVAHSTSFGGALEGRWGSITVRIRAKEPMLPCFFYDTATGKGWFGSWLGRFSRKMLQRPMVLGRAGLYAAGFELTLAHPFVYLK